jgi:hypothetical protein
MIVRISGEDQYRLEESDRERLNELDNEVLTIVRGNEEDGFRQAYGRLLEFVRARGTRVSDEDIETSDLILPPPDLSFAEAREEFTGEGLIPD